MKCRHSEEAALPEAVRLTDELERLRLDVTREAALKVQTEELERLRAEQHEMTCPACQTTIRSRLADTADRIELERLRGVEKRAREVCNHPRLPESTRTGAEYILGEA